jgi:hypothetical protein
MAGVSIFVLPADRPDVDLAIQTDAVPAAPDATIHALSIENERKTPARPLISHMIREMPAAAAVIVLADLASLPGGVVHFRKLRLVPKDEDGRPG